MIISTKTAQIASGTLSKDAEFKTVGEKNTAMLKFGIAAEKDGENTIWINCQAWAKLANTWSDKLKKGDIVLVCGKKESREWEGKTYETLVADFIQKVDSGSSSGGTSQTVSKAKPSVTVENKPKEPDPNAFIISDELDDEGFPF